VAAVFAKADARPWWSWMALLGSARTLIQCFRLSVPFDFSSHCCWRPALLELGLVPGWFQSKNFACIAAFVQVFFFLLMG